MGYWRKEKYLIELNSIFKKVRYCLQQVAYMKKYDDDHYKNRKQSRLDIIWVIVLLLMFLFIVLTGLSE